MFKDGRTNANYTNLLTSKAKLIDTVNLSKNKYFKHLGDKLNNPSTSSKTYWSIIKPLLMERRLLSFLPYYLMINLFKLVEKANIFSDFFSRQCQPMSSDSTLLSIFLFETTNRLSNVNIRPEKMIKMIKTCGPLQLLFNNCVKQEVSPNIWKMANVLPVHNKRTVNI